MRTLSKALLSLFLVMILSLLALGVWSLLAPEKAYAVVYVVTLTSDTPAAPLPGVVGELRWAINMANASVGVPDVIVFALPGPGLNTIMPAAPLPAVTDTVLIDGYTQPGSAPPGAGTPAVILVELDGSLAGPADGLVFQGGPASNSQVRGLAVNRFMLNGIVIQGTSAITVDGNNIGTDAVGGVQLRNWQSGIFIQAGASFNVIGGPNPANRNVISGNNVNGVHIDSSNSNVVEGNYIGTDANGTGPLGNNVGVFLDNGSVANVVGGTAAGQRNVISRNNSYGVAVSSSTGNFIQGNYIGTDVSGNVSLNNFAPGVYIYNGANNNVVGGNTAGHRNLISGNWGAGVMIDSSTGCGVSGNYVGTDAAGGAALPNGTGVYITGGGSHTVGGTAAADGNLLSGNGYQGVYITSSTGNTVSANLIGTDVSGMAGLGNSQDGIWLNGADSNTLGGTTAGQRNLISDNGWAGVCIDGSNTNTVSGNYVGTDAAGSAGLGNSQQGVLLEGGSSGNTVGGNTPGHRNLISGNSGDGIGIDGSTGNFVRGNYIGTDAGGGAALANGGNGMYLSNSSSGNTVGGTTAGECNVISGNSGDGIGIDGSTGNFVRGNYIGTDAGGGAALANGGNGMYLSNSSSGNTVGGGAAGQCNVISGNASNGIRVEGSDGNTIRGNYVGTNTAGSTAVANGVNGIYLFGGSDSNTIGGSAAGQGNVVSGNASNGIRLETSGGNMVSGNRVGTNTAGSAAVPNGWNGIYVANSSGNTIGGVTSGHRNVVSGNSSHGVWLMAGSTGNAVEGNYIGTDSTGGARLQNNFFGVYISNANGNTIGGSSAGQRNVISGNNGTGVSIDVSDNNNVYGNYIGTNATGSAALKNNGSGVFIGNGASGNAVGGSAAGQGNLISGNGQDGVRAGLALANNVQGNYIGTDASGTAAVRNELDGVSIDTSSTGMVIGGGSAGEGNVISGNASDGVEIESSTGNYVRGNRIGINAAGGVLANLGNGVYLRNGANNNTVGGSAAGEGNVISGNASDGVEIESSTGNYVRGNRIGINAAGGVLANLGNGVYLRNGANNNTVGGSAAGQGNLVSGNQFSGIRIAGCDDSNVYGNRIGTDASGSAALGNNGTGVHMTAGSDGNDIGGGSAGQRNVISGNLGYGVLLEGVSSGAVAGNYIGTNAAGTSPVANGFMGIKMSNVTFTTIGGSSAGEGNVISGNTGSGVYLENSDDNFLQGNYIGTDASGISAVGNGISGLTLTNGSNSNTIGGATAGHRNVISGNTSEGILIDASLNNNLWGNYVGTDAAGTSSLANHRGIYLFDGADSNHVGSATAGEGNVISGNTLEGVLSYNSTGNDIQGNYVGTNASGTAGLGNQTGVYLDDNSSSNRVGGSSAGSGNLISSNITYGVRVRNSSGNSIQGNRVGTNAAGTGALGNGDHGVFAADSDQTAVGGAAASAESNLVSGNGGGGVYIYRSINCSVNGNNIGTDAAGAADLGNASNGILVHECAGSNTIGGSESSANLIAYNDSNGVSITGSTDCRVSCNEVINNGETGVVIWDAASIRNRVSRNTLYGNGGLGIDLMGDGVTPNDGNNNNPAKADRGYNFPVFAETEFPVAGGSADVSGTAPPSAQVEFYYVGAAQDPSGHGEGLTYLGTADADGSGDFSATLNGLSTGDWVSAIAISPAGDASGDGNTSEFSANVQMQQGYAVTASVSGGNGTVDPETQTVFAGEDASIDIYPDTYYVIESITDNEAPAAVDNPYVIYDLAENHDVVVTFTLESYAVNAAVSGGGGSVNPATQNIQRYSSASIDLQPDPGYHVDTITDNGVPQEIADPYVIDSVEVLHNVTVTFARDISPLSTWYLAEGSTDWGFDCYVSVVNPNDEAIEARVTYMTSSGPVTGPTVNMPAKSQATVFPSATLGARDFSTKVECSGGQAISVDRTMYWTGAGAPCSEAHCATGVTAPAATWYMPEGSSAWGFECFLLIQNPNASSTQATVTWMVQGGSPQQSVFTVPANSRATYNMADYIGAADASIKVEADKSVICERAMYRNDRREGHDSGGTTTPAVDYYLAEGCTGFGFTTWVLVQNPQSTPTDVTITYQAASGPVQGPAFTMPPNSRVSVNVNDTTAIPGPDPSFSTRVHGSAPIIAERAMYWNGGADGGQVCHDSIGLSAPHATWYLADGQTSDGRETWTLVQNPNDTAVSVRITYMTPTGAGNVVKTETIPAGSRRSFNMADHSGINGRAAIMVECTTSGKKVMCERAMYWNDRGAGTDTIGGYSD